MGKRGPKPTPTAVLKLRGSWRARARKAEPQPLGAAVMPGWLKGDAKKKWEQLKPQLEAMKVLTDVDAEALARYCDTWSWWRKMRDWLDENGETYESVNKNGDEYSTLYPQVNLALKLAGQLSKLETEFGLTPAARAGISALEKGAEKASPKNRFFGNCA